MRYLQLVLISTILVLGGCDPFSIPSLLLNGADLISYIQTGKGVSDHVLSKVVSRDCAVWRIVKDGKICSTLNSQIVDEMMKMDCELFAWDSKDKLYCKGEKKRNDD
jgi:hypothetical protein